MFCSQCGKSNLLTAKFCTQCGNVLVQSDALPIVDTVAEHIDSAPISNHRNQILIPPGIDGWSWGAFIFGWFWAVCNKTWIGLLALLPGVGFIMHIILGFKGREWAWQNDQWDSVEHFQKVQRRWSQWGIGIVILCIGFFVLMIFLTTSTTYWFNSTNTVRL
jgi:zinc-ribbon domain